MDNSSKIDQGKELNQIVRGEGYAVIQEVADDIRKRTRTDLEESEKGADINRGRLRSLDELFRGIDELVKTYNKSKED